MPKTVMIGATIFYAIVLVFMALPLALMVPIFALFGLPAYGSAFSKVVLVVYLVAGATFPLVMVASIAGAWITHCKNLNHLTAVFLALPVPHILMFLVPLLIWFGSRPEKLAKLTPSKIAEIINDARPEQQEAKAEKYRRDANAARLRSLQTLVETSPRGSFEQLMGYLQCARERMRQGDYKGAIGDYESYESLHEGYANKEDLPDNAMILRYLANAHFLNNDLQRALQLCNQVAKLPQPESSVRELLRLRWRVYDRLGQTDLSIADQHMLADRQQIVDTFQIVGLNKHQGRWRAMQRQIQQDF